MRGYTIIGLSNPKRDNNVGGALRAAHVYGAMGVIITNKYNRQRTDTTGMYRHIPLYVVDDLMSIVPYDCVPISGRNITGCEKFNYLYAS